MKKQNFVKLSQVTLPLDHLQLKDNELIAIKGGVKPMFDGNNCNCSCSDGSAAGVDGSNCNCSC